ncbi:MAG: PD-(D/E)XK nuclease family protein [Clostridia bacterium]|nr:PD-(D/E)XK nuclease family protein [Clostridia bacterium]
MLYLILSRAGGGKTAHIMNLIGQFAKGGNKKLTLIVPEQFSFMSEKLMLEKFGAKAMADVDVLSFTSLGEKLVGRPALHERRRLDDSAKAVLMRNALGSVKDKLRLYANHVTKKSVISDFIALSSEFRQNSVSTDSVRLALAEEKEGLLKMKLNDIVTVLDAYDAMVSGSYFNPDTLLDELYDILPENGYFKDRLVFIDGFRGFTVQEYKVIERMLAKAETVYVTLCTDDLQNGDDETELFAHTKRTAHRLIESAKKCGVPVAKPQYLSMRSKFNNFPPQFERYASPELAALEQELFSPAPNKYEEDCGNITLCKAVDIYAECEYIACTAKKLIREEGYRCRDIAVIARDSSAYEAPLRSALKKCGISVFDDSRQPVDTSPVVNLVTCAVGIASGGFDTETVMRYLKTELTGFTAEEISRVENYCYLWQINRGGWLKEWTQHPRGFGEKTEDEDTAELESLNALRLRIINPLCSLRDALSDTDGTAAAKAIFDFLMKVNVPENLKQLADYLTASGETGIALELDRMWNVVMDLLDSLATVAGERAVNASEIAEILDLMLSAQTVGSLPQGLDEITIGSADRIRTVTPKAVFVAGANSGVFPATPSSGSALTDKDRRRMSEIGIGLSDFGEYKLAEEKLIAYNTLCCASHKLYVCCPERNSQNEQLAPSELYTKIKTLFPKCREVDASCLDGLYYIEGENLAFEQLAKNRSEESTLGATLEEYFGDREDFAGRIASLERAGGLRDFSISDKSAALKLFGNNLYISASKVESFYKCPFSYFCRYGIKAMPRKIAELDPMQRGNVIHHVLEKLLADYDSETLLGMAHHELLDIITSLMNAYLMEKLDGSQRDERFLYLYHKLALTVCDVAERLIKELSLSDFRPVDFELSIGFDGKIPSYEVETEKGKISISGAIDRVDKAVINGKTYLRIVDYKSSGKAFRLSDVLQGLNMQMFIYLFTLWQNGKERYGEITPAGVLYYPANSPLVSAERGEAAEDVALKKQKKCRMQGIVLNDCDVVVAMDKSAGGLYIPVDFNAKGEMKGSLIRLSQLEKLKEKADALLVEMADALHSGRIEAVPSFGASYKNVCQYCDYKSVCSYEEDIPVKELLDTDTDEALRNLEKEDDADGLDE